MTNAAWEAIFEFYHIYDHDFDLAPFPLTATQIRAARVGYSTAGELEPRILCKQDTRESRPRVFQERGLFILPTRNGQYAILRGEGYIDIPEILSTTEIYESQLDFALDTVMVGNSEMQHLDFAYATGLIHTIMTDTSLILSVQKYVTMPPISFHVGKHKIEIEEINVEVDSGYEGREQIVLVKIINPSINNLPSYTLYYPHRFCTYYSNKPVKIIFFERLIDEYGFWIGDFSSNQSISSFSISQVGRWRIRT